MTDRRTVSRQRSFLGGVLSHSNGTASQDCLVRNLSERGALVELPHPLAPEAFELVIPGRRFRAAARVAWQAGGRFGLALEAPAAAKDAPRPALRDEGY